jgi:hypothetical protein
VATSGSGVAGESNWRWCKKCQSLAYAGGSTLGSCSAGGNHDHTGSGDYVLAFNAGTVPAYEENNWRHCRKCHVLSLAGGAALGACAAGGTHDHAGSGDHLLAFAVGADTILHDAYMSALKPQ